METWKPVLGHEGRYEVSDKGRVRSAVWVVKQRARGGDIYEKQVGGRLLKPGIASNGYPTVVLGKGNTRTVHSLVAQAFIGPPPPGMEVMHKNGLRKDARLTNLKYGTRSENNRQTVHDGRRRVTVAQVHWARDLMRSGKRGSVTTVARVLGVSLAAASAIKHGVYYKHV